MEKTFYEILGCSRSNTIEQISQEYKRLALKYHPDKNKDDSSEMFKKIQEAYKVLTEARQLYDSWLDSGLDVSYKQWKDHVSKNGHMMHWRNTDPRRNRLTDTNIPRKDLYEKFRNYEI
jgi:DnaJ family protein C protein 12